MVRPGNNRPGKKTQLFQKQKCVYLQVVNVTTTGKHLEDFTVFLNFFIIAKAKRMHYRAIKTYRFGKERK